MKRLSASANGWFKTFKRKLLRNHRDYGLMVLFGKVANGVLGVLGKRIGAIIYELDPKDNSIAIADENGFAFVLIDGTDTAIISRIEKMAEWLEGELLHDLSTGKRLCMVALDGGKLVGFYLAVFGSVFLPTLTVEVELGPGEVWGEEIVISKQYRRRGIATVLKSKVYEELWKRGARSVYGCVGIYNRASLMSAARFTLKNAHYVRLLKVLRTRKLVLSRISNDLHEGRGMGQRKRCLWKVGQVPSKIVVRKDKFALHYGHERDRNHALTITTTDFS